MSVRARAVERVRQAAKRLGGAPTSDGPRLFAEDAYGGYTDDDVARIASLARSTEPTPGFVTDFVGVRTRPGFLPPAATYEGTTIGEVPVPGDRLHAETIEYAALARVLHDRRPGAFVVYELGAGWGPWMALAGVLARRLGQAGISLVGVEADPNHLEFCKQHLVDNGLRPAGDDLQTELGGVRCELLAGAVWFENTELAFPDGDPMDYALAARSPGDDVEYRGFETPHRMVPAFGLGGLLAKEPVVDFVHLDIQGAELDVIERSLDALGSTVRYLFVGTHSRQIEGNLFALLGRNGWELLNEKPCRFVLDPAVPTLEGMTTRDGAQFWRNRRLA